MVNIVGGFTMGRGDNIGIPTKSKALSHVKNKGATYNLDTLVSMYINFSVI